MSGKFAIKIADPFPWIDCGEMRRVCGGYLPLSPGEVGNAVHADFPVAPTLRSGPFDEIIAILHFLGTHKGQIAFGMPGTALIGVDYDVAVPAPIDRIRRFKFGIFIEVFIIQAGISQH